MRNLVRSQMKISSGRGKTFNLLPPEPGRRGAGVTDLHTPALKTWRRRNQ